MSGAANPVARKATNPLSLNSPDQFFVLVLIIPQALLESLSETRSFAKLVILGVSSRQSLAASKSNSLAASGASLDSMDFFSSFLASALR